LAESAAHRAQPGQPGDLAYRIAGDHGDARSVSRLLQKALRWGRPEIFNSDQGSQFAGEKFTGVLN